MTLAFVATLATSSSFPRLRRTRAGIELIPENPEFSTLLVKSGDESFALEGIAVGLIRNTMLT